MLDGPERERERKRAEERWRASILGALETFTDNVR